MTIIFLKTHLPRWLLLVSLTLISGCTSFGPKGTENFDHTFSRTIEPEELLEHYTRCNVYAGTYMEGEMASVPVFEGMLVVTDHRLIFTQWDKSEQRYKPLIWIQYKDIKKAIGLTGKISKLSKNSLLIEVLSENQLTKLKNIKKVEGHVVTVQPYKTLNFVKGIHTEKSQPYMICLK